MMSPTSPTGSAITGARLSSALVAVATCCRRICSDFEDVTGVELNPIFIDWLTHRFRNYNHLADLPGTRFFVDEARSWFARTTERFDLIEMSLIDTWAATGAGAFSLSENGLYTVEGWQHFLNASDSDWGTHGLALVRSAQHHRDRPAAESCERRAAQAWRRRSEGADLPGRCAAAGDDHRGQRAVLLRRSEPSAHGHRRTGIHRTRQPRPRRCVSCAATRP